MKTAIFADGKGIARQLLIAAGAICISAIAIPSHGQTFTAQAAQLRDPLPAAQPSLTGTTPAVQQLLSFRDSDVKFHLETLMETLRDRRHEGWVLAAYPDPKTSQPLIGAGFSLDLPAREHPQRDPLNPHQFLEPSSAELWQAAGLDSQRLQRLLAQFHEHMASWSKRQYRSRIRTLSPQITEDEATSLLRVAAIQATDNARAYCRNFDRLTASQQMALSHLVYQMGVNLEEFSQFLGLINGESIAQESAYWRTVQQSLVESQWARLYRIRATSVIAMLDPRYPQDPVAAEQRVKATLLPAVAHRRRGRIMASHQVASYHAHSGRAAAGRKARSKSKRRA